MHSSGSIIKTYCEKVRHYLDDPDLDAKYDDNYLVRFFLSSAMTDVISRVSMMSDAPISVHLNLLVAAGTKYYVLPPGIKQVLRVGTVDSATGTFIDDFKPRNEFSIYGPGWSLEGNTITFNPPPAAAKTYTLVYIPSGDISCHYHSAAAGTLNANGTFTMVVSPTIGSLDKRDQSYVGAYLRILGASLVDELIINTHDAASRVVSMRNVSKHPVGSYSYEVVPFLLEPMLDAIALSASMRAGVGRKITAGHQQGLLIAYRQAIKTAYDTIGNMNARAGKSFQSPIGPASMLETSGSSSGYSPTAGSSGGLTVLNPSPTGSYVLASLTIDAYGRTTTASNTPDVASEATQQQILLDVGILITTITGGIDGGVF